jgi:hypothetical protein
VLSDWTDDATPIDPATVDWQAVADGKIQVRLRRGPGPWNSMGDMKFNMPNDFGIYLHDVPDPERELFTKDDRWISNGCIRLEDAHRLAKWLFGDLPHAKDPKAEENVDLPEPVPVYITYLTAEAGPNGPKFRPDPYNRDPALLARYFGEGQSQVAELAALAGRHIHAHNSDYNLNAAAGIAYGLTDRLTISAELPYVRRDGLREGEHSHSGGVVTNSVVPLGSVSGIGDATVLAKYQLAGSPGEGIALIGGLKLPTGSTHKRRADGERLETEHQPGTGSWDPVVGAAASTRIGALRIDASALWQMSGKGAQDTELGDRVQGGIALSHRFGPAEHHHEAEPHELAGVEEHKHAEPEPHGHSSWDTFVELTGGWEGRQQVAGEVERESGGAAVWLAPGARFNAASGWSAALSAGVPVWQHIRSSHPDNRFRVQLSLAKAL